MAESPQKDDPEGTASVSETEQKDRVDQIARDFIGLPPRPTKDPEGTRQKK
jgi:hypothetical protein